MAGEPKTSRDIIVIGASAGGVQALQELMGGLPADLAAAIFVVVHTSPSSPGILPQILERAGPLPAAHAEDGERFRKGRIYVAPPDAHLLLKGERMLVTRGPKENGFRPAVDVLFRTAARSLGPRVVGIVLTGGLDDGTLGLIHIKKEGGIAIAQDPQEAVFASMPQSAIDNAEVDHVVAVAAMPALLARMASEPMPPLPRGVVMKKPGDIEDDVAEVGSAKLLKDENHGPPTSFTCPECGGSLWERKEAKLVRFACHVGHSYTGESLLAEKSDQLESVLWTALRALEETADLRRRMARRAAKGPASLVEMSRRYEKQAKDAEQRAGILREALTNRRTPAKNGRSRRVQEKAKHARSQAVNGGQKGEKTKRRSNGNQ